MVKHLCGYILAVFCLICLASAEAVPVMVADDAHVYSQAEITAMENIISDLRERYQMDVAVWTTYAIPNSYGDDSVTVAWADKYYEDNGYGLGEDRSGVLFVLDLTNRYNYLSDAGTMADYLNDHRIEELLSAADDDLAFGDYGSAMLAQLNKLSEFLRRGIERGQFRYDSATGERLTGLYNKLTVGEMLLAAAAGLVAGLGFYAVIVAKYHIRGSTYKYKRDNMNVRLYRDDEQFLRERVSRVRNVSSSSGGSRGGMGSGMHTSSGGMSHGGGGHHF